MPLPALGHCVHSTLGGWARRNHSAATGTPGSLRRILFINLESDEDRRRSIEEECWAHAPGLCERFPAFPAFAVTPEKARLYSNGSRGEQLVNAGGRIEDLFA